MHGTCVNFFTIDDQLESLIFLRGGGGVNEPEGAYTFGRWFNIFFLVQSIFGELFFLLISDMLFDRMQ